MYIVKIVHLRKLSYYIISFKLSCVFSFKNTPFVYGRITLILKKNCDFHSKSFRNSNIYVDHMKLF